MHTRAQGRFTPRGTLLVAVLAAGCERTADPCAVAQKSGDPGRTIEACDRTFAETADPQQGLASLRARVQRGSLVEAEAQLRGLAGTPAEAPALVALTEAHLRGRKPEAMTRANGAIDRLVALGSHAEASALARALGHAAWATSRYEEALDAYDRADREAERAGDAGLKHKALRGVFTMLYELGDLRGARRLLDETARNSASLDTRSRALLTLDRGLLAEAEGHDGNARAAFAEVLRSPAAVGATELSWVASLNLLALTLNAGDRVAAEKVAAQVEDTYLRGKYAARPSSRIARGYYRARLELLRGDAPAALTLLTKIQADSPSRQWGWKLALVRGEALEALGQDREALASFQASAKIVDDLRGDQYDDFKSWLIKARRRPFDKLFELHVRRGELFEALDVLERTQGRTFLDAFVSGATDQTPGRRPDLPGRVDWLRRLYPALRASPVLQTPAPFKRLAPGLRGDHLLAFYETERQMYVIAIAGGRPRVYPAAVPLQRIRELVARTLEAPGDRVATTELSQALIRPELLPAPGGLLYLIPSTALGRLAFGALPVGTGAGQRYLVERHVLAQVPSINALASLRKQGRATAGRAVVLADAAGDLPEAREEATSVTALLGGAPSVRTLVQAQATTEQLRNSGETDVLHLAVHSGVGATGPWLGLADRRLLAPELLDLKVSAGLVVLASCASAATPDPGLWGSLAAAFLASGSRSVVGSLWSTEDTISRQFVERFYREGGRRSPAEALAATQRAWIKEGRGPSHWAAFAYFGTGAGRAVRPTTALAPAPSALEGNNPRAAR